MLYTFNNYKKYNKYLKYFSLYLLDLGSIINNYYPLN